MSTIQEIHKEIAEGESAHQAILNVFYRRWWAGDYGGYPKMVDAAGGENPLYSFAILIGKYHQQVCNGGHIQYVENGYASSEGIPSSDSDLDLHQRLIEYTQEFLPEVSPIKAPLLGIMKQLAIDVFTTCTECGGSGEYEGYDEEGEESTYETCDYCGGTGESPSEYGYTEISIASPDQDHKYGRISEQVEAYLETFFGDAISNMSDVSELGPADNHMPETDALQESIDRMIKEGKTDSQILARLTSKL